jgi:plastocyanin
MLMEKELSQGMPWLFVALLISVGLPMQAETHHVTVDGSGFAPASLPVQVGDTVVWENVDDWDFSHTTTSTLGMFDPNYWNGYLVSLGDTFARTFNNEGAFDYIDQLGDGTGTITVSPAVVTPVIKLESPRMAGGQFLFEATGLTTGKTNVLLSSTNLTTWLPVSTNAAASGSITFSNATVLGRGCYRVVELP